jgi:uncharacterized protein YndB with AHSA1/START domain
MTMTIQKSIHVKRPLDAAFKLFTADIGKWWPLKEGFSFGGERADQIHLECRHGGRFYERFRDGEEFEVGTVTVYEPPSRVVFTWKAPTWDAPTEVEVRFAADGAGTRVELEHRGWERAGAAAAPMSERYAGGWETILKRYQAA